MSLAFPDVAPTSQTWRLLSSTAVMQSPLSGLTQRLARPGDRWSCRMTFANLSGDDRAQMQRFLTQCRGSLESFYIPAFGNPTTRGNYTEEIEKIPDPYFLTDVSNWTAANAVITHNHRRLRLESDGAGEARARYQATVTDATAYVLVTHHTRGNRALNGATIRVGTTAGGADLLAGTTVESDRLVASFVSSGTAAHVQMRGASVVDEFDFWDYVSLYRCPRVDGASQTGQTLNIKNAGLSAGNPLLLAGDFVEVNGQLLQVATDVYKNGTSEAVLQFTTPMHSSPSNSEPVIINRPMMKAVLAQTDNGWSDAPPAFSSFQLQCVEVVE